MDTKVASLIGQATIESPNGNKQPLGNGDVARPGDIIVAGDNSSVRIEFASGQIVELAANEQFVIPDDGGAVEAGANPALDIEAIQLAVKEASDNDAAGEQSSENGAGDVVPEELPPPAAGISPAAPLQNTGFSGQEISALSGLRGNPEAGFATGTQQADEQEVVGLQAIPSGGIPFVDTVPPASPVVTLVSDSGNSGSDRLTNSGFLSVSGVEEGATVEYSTDGTNWTTTFSPVEGDNTVFVRQTDTAGNTSESTSLSFTLDTTADADNNFGITVAASDKVTNAEEAADVTLTLSGVDTDAASVEVTFIDQNGNTVTAEATQQPDGSWTVSDTDLSDLVDGDVTVSAEVTDDAGNTKTVTDTLDLDTTADSDNNFGLNVVASDKVTNAAEAPDVSLTLNGVDADAERVDVTFTDKDGNTVTAEATRQPDGSWTVSDTDLSDLVDGDVTVSAEVTDDAGNTKTVTDTLDLDTTADSDNNFGLNVVASDKVTNAAEAPDVSLTLNGVDEDAERVDVTFTDKDGNTVTTEATLQDGSWTVSDTDLSDLVDGDVTVSAEVTDDAGNTKTVTDTLDLDTTADSDNNFGVTVAASDKITNAAEAPNVSLTLNGVDEDAVTVKVTFTDKDGKTVTTDATQLPNGSWTVPDADLSGLVDGDVTISAEVTDDADNTKTVTDTLDLDTTADSDNNFGIRVVGSDKTINAKEALSVGLTLGGVDEDVATVNVTFTDKDGNKVTAEATKQSDGSWVSDSDLSVLVDGNVSISAEVTDEAGNTKLTSDNVTLATGKPTVEISAVDTRLSAGESTTITFEFSEDVADFVEGDVTVAGGSLSNFTKVDGNTWTATFTQEGTDAPRVTIADDSYTDLAGNDGSGDSLDLTADITAPTVEIRAVDTHLSAGESTTITFEFSEDVADFVEGDVTVAGGSLSNFIKVDGNTWTATFTQEGTDAPRVTIADDSYTDLAGNDGSGDSLDLTADITAPTVEISAVDTRLSAGESTTITFEFSEDVADFVEGDVTVAGGSLSNFIKVDGKTWTATFTQEGTDAPRVTIADDSYTDLAGNDGSGDSLDLTADITAPTVEISAVDTRLSAGESTTITFEFSEDVADFVEGDVTVAGGSLSNFIKVDGKTWTATFTQEGTDAPRVTIADDSYTDLAGNDGSGDSLDLTADITAPTVEISAVDTSLSAGESTTITFEFSEDVADFVEGDVTVAGGSLSNFIKVDGKTWTATFTQEGTDAPRVTIADDSYTDLAGNDGSGDSLDLTADITAPTVEIRAVDTHLSAGESTTITFEFSEDVADFVEVDVTVAGGSLSNFTKVDGNTWTATFTQEGTDAPRVTIADDSYTDLAGNDGSGDSLDLTADITAPTVEISAVDTSLSAGESTTITFQFSEEVRGFTVADVAVKGGRLSNFTKVDGDTWTATFTQEGADTPTISVSKQSGQVYTDVVGNQGGSNELTLTFDNTNTAPETSNGLIEGTENGLEGSNLSGGAGSLLTTATDSETANSSLTIGAVNGLAGNVGNAITVPLTYTDAEGRTQIVNVQLTVNADGSYTIDQKSLDALPEGAVASGSVSYQVTDGSALSQPATIAIEITGNNDAPVINVQNDEISYVVNSGAQSLTPAVDISDIDSRYIDSVTIEITGNYNSGDEIAFSGDDPEGMTLSEGPSGTFVLSADVSNTITKEMFEAALAALVFTTTDTNYDSNDRTLTWTVNDGGSENATASDASTIVMNGVAITGISEDTAIPDDFRTSDLDDLEISGTVNLGAGDKLQINLGDGNWIDIPVGNISDGQWTYVDKTGHSDGSSVDYQVRIVDSADAVKATDSQTVNFDNSKPTLDLDKDEEGTSYQANFVEVDNKADSPRVSLADTDLEIGGSATLSEVVITLTNAKRGDLLEVGTLPDGITAEIKDNVVILKGFSTIDEYRDAIGAVTFTNLRDDVSTDDRVFEVVLNDGANKSDPAYTTITVTPFDDGIGVILDASDGLNTGSQLTAVITDPDGQPATADDVSYLWEVSTDGLNWTTVSGATGQQYTIPDDAAEGSLYRVTVEYTDGQGFDGQISTYDTTGWPTLSAKPIEQWSFDEGEGNSTSNEYENKPGNLDSLDSDPIPGWVAGQSGAEDDSALDFSTGKGVVRIDPETTAQLSSGTTTTLSYWIKTTATGNDSGNTTTKNWNNPSVLGTENFGGGDDIQWGVLDSNGKVGLGIANETGVVSDTAINDDQWHHVVVTREVVSDEDATVEVPAGSSRVKVYIDGVLDAEGVILASSQMEDGYIASDQLAGIGITFGWENGVEATDGHRYLDAQLDDIQIYDKVLTDAEAASIYASQKTAGYNFVELDGESILLNIAASTDDSDKSNIKLELTGLAQGTEITAEGLSSPLVVGADGRVDISSLTSAQLARLSVTLPAGEADSFVFNVIATSEDGVYRTSKQFVATGVDNVIVEDASDTHNGSNTDRDFVRGHDGDDTINGNGGNDLLFGDAGADAVNGGLGSDILFGGTDNDSLNGGFGQDELWGESGSDTLSGGSGQDTFVFSADDLLVSQTVQLDTITDFELGNADVTGSNADILDLSKLIALQGSEELSVDTLLDNGFTVKTVGDGSTDTVLLFQDNNPATQDLEIVLENVAWTDLNDNDVVSPEEVLKQLIDNGQIII
ncbi:Ig-like domain-containing protein [Parendozoicomonas haliclonae]|uniref:Bifunctional hemolysin/adenylate cyclase n=1 Tax=Parendozoicomonas haliclonae TaxID=1960125 RepID=A0A1X7APM5_9GAMM|nr:Ig-like domain-containing protein [Parendozoicomonas haliclonae]SMA50039.1 Bifunctional hemolysin/adenylate cyclase precursor [Parendozoicomonas haliclonae]